MFLKNLNRFFLLLMKRISNYLFFFQYLKLKNRSLLAIFCFFCLAIVSCTQNKSTNSLKFSSSELSKILNLPTANIARVGNLYSFIQDGQDAIFFTGMYECRAKLKGNEAALSRQLYVGFENLRIIDQASLPDISALRVVASSTIDDIHLSLVSYSSRDNNCITDVIFWTPDLTTNYNENPYDAPPLSDPEKIAWADKYSPKFQEIFLNALASVPLQTFSSQINQGESL